MPRLSRNVLNQMQTVELDPIVCICAFGVIESPQDYRLRTAGAGFRGSRTMQEDQNEARQK